MTKGRQQLTLMGERPHCLQCEGIELRRQGRFGFWQRVVLSRFGLFPWECGLCRKIYLLPQRSMDYHQEATEAAAPAPVVERVPLPVLAQRPMHAASGERPSR